MRVLTSLVLTLAFAAPALASESVSLPGLTLSGYVQARYTHAPQASGFGVRRGRLKAAHATDWSRAVVQIDATPSGVSLKDAEATFIEPWTGRKTSLTLGQTKLPFGFEGPQSSSVRVFPERSAAVRAFVAGERDRGAKLNARVGFFRLDVGVFNGNGISSPGDNDRKKDVVGRVGVDFEGISGGVSGWWGATLDADQVSAPRDRAGVDLRVKRSLFGFGDTAFVFEGLLGRTWVRNGVEQAGDFGWGGQASVVQHFGNAVRAAFRYDRFATAGDTRDTFALAAAYDATDALRFGAALEVPVVSGAAQHVLTLQLQAKL